MNKLTTIIITLIILSACSPATAQPTPRLTELTSAPQREGVLQLERPTKHYAADRVGWAVGDKTYNLEDFALLGNFGINLAITSMDVNGTEAAWNRVSSAARAAEMSLVIWPSYWAEPRPRGSACNYESPFPVTPGGDITNIKRILDWAVTQDNVIGIITFHESTSNCRATTQELAGLRSQIQTYTNGKIKVWGYAGNLTDTEYWTNSAIANAMDVLVEWKACAARADSPCNALPARVTYDRNRLIAAGLSDKIEQVFLMQSYAITGSATYGGRLSISEYNQLACALMETDALDGIGYYTWRGGWYSGGELYNWREMWSIIPGIYNSWLNPANPRIIPTITAAAQTVTPMSKMPICRAMTTTPQPVTNTPVATLSKTPTPSKTVTPALTSTATIAPSKTPTATPAPGCVWIIYEQSADTIVLKCK